MSNVNAVSCCKRRLYIQLGILKEPNDLRLVGMHNNNKNNNNNNNNNNNAQTLLYYTICNCLANHNQFITYLYPIVFVT